MCKLYAVMYDNDIDNIEYYKSIINAKQKLINCYISDTTSPDFQPCIYEYECVYNGKYEKLHKYIVDVSNLELHICKYSINTLRQDASLALDCVIISNEKSSNQAIR